jgi:hypothetical protein
VKSEGPVPSQFIGREIEVTTGGEIKVPVSFTLDGRTYAVTEIVQQWQDHGFGPSSGGRRNRWWQRRHRNYYVVRTTGGELFEIYFDRGANMKHPEFRRWYAHTRLETAGAGSPAHGTNIK